MIERKVPLGQSNKWSCGLRDRMHCGWYFASSEIENEILLIYNQIEFIILVG